MIGPFGKKYLGNVVSQALEVAGGRRAGRQEWS